MDANNSTLPPPGTDGDPIERLARALPILLGDLPTRAQLSGLPAASGARRYRVNVHRSLPFEYSAKMVNLFSATWDASFEFQYSSYDPALSQISSAAGADIELFWIDWRIQRENLSPRQAVEWFSGRVGTLRRQSSKPVLVNNWPTAGDPAVELHSGTAGPRAWTLEFNRLLSEDVDRLADACVVDLDLLQSRIGSLFFDHRNDLVSHYPFSDKATLLIARHFACQAAPVFLIPRLKAVVLDLDNTLYSGILGEDGPQGVSLTDEHDHLHRFLLALKKSGTLLALCSKNKREDVLDLFQDRKDFPLRFEDFAASEIGWGLKSESIRKIARKLNIDPSAMLFVDDNPSELSEVHSSLPGLKLIRALPQASLTEKCLSNYPGLYLHRRDLFGASRTLDVQANASRESLRESSGDGLEYLGQLRMRVQLYRDHRPHTERLHEMSNKFNQFNLSLLRMTEAQTRGRFESGHVILTVGLSDVFADSGIVGAFVGALGDGGTAVLEEVLFSCRVLGRKVEDLAFLHFLRILSASGVRTLTIAPVKGPKNEPAVEWAEGYRNGATGPLPVKDLIQKAEAATRGHPAEIQEVS